MVRGSSVRQAGHSPALAYEKEAPLSERLCEEKVIRHNLILSFLILLDSDIFMGLSPSEGLIVKNAWWFLSSLLIAMFILYPFLLRNFRFASRYVFPLVSFLVLGYLYNTK